MAEQRLRIANSESSEDKMIESIDRNFRALFEQKEKELVSICEQQIEVFRRQILEQANELASVTAKFTTLKEDFKYNLELLDGRDAELAGYESKMTELEASLKAAKAQREETEKKRQETNIQLVQEKRRSEDKDNHYQHNLFALRQQIESLKLTRNELLVMHKKAFETLCTELNCEMERKRADLQSYSLTLEGKYQEKLQVQEFQSKLAVEAIKNKLFFSETQIKQLESDLSNKSAEQRLSLQTESDLRDEILEKSRIIKRLTKKLQDCENENDILQFKVESNEDTANQATKKLHHLEGEYKRKMKQLELRTMDLQKGVEAAESRLRVGQEHTHRDLANYLDKVDNFERIMMVEDKHFKSKVDEVEKLMRENTIQQDKLIRMVKNQHLLSGPVGHRSRIMDKSLPQHAPCNSIHDHSRTYSFGSSLPQASPILSPSFSSPEASMNGLTPTDREEQETEKISSLMKENQSLRGSIQNLKDQNERIRSVVGTMRKEMESLQRVTKEEGTRIIKESQSREDSNTIKGSSAKDDMNMMMEKIMQSISELQQAQQIKSEDMEKGKKAISDQIEQPPQETKVDANMKSDESAAKIAELERVQNVLRTQLEKAAEDILRIASERDLLMELSNSMHADFRRSTEEDMTEVRAAERCANSSKFQERRPRARVTSPCSRSSPSRARPSSSNDLPRSDKQGHCASHCQGCKDICAAQNVSSVAKEDDERLCLKGRMSSLQERPDLSQDFVHKGTPSQKLKLQTCMKRQQAQMSNRIKVRNYNIKEDDLV